MDERQLERDLGAAVRSLRVAKGVTREQLAEMANVSLGALRNLETGVGANVTTLVRAVHALGADHWLTGLTPPAVPFSPLAVVEQVLHAPPPRQRSRARARR